MIRPAKTDPLRTAMIGTGRISEEHLNALRTIRSARLVAVCDLSPTVARYAADRFGVEHAYTDYRPMLADLSPGVMHVLTPPHTHVAMVTDCLNAGGPRHRRKARGAEQRGLSRHLGHGQAKPAATDRRSQLQLQRAHTGPRSAGAAGGAGAGCVKSRSEWRLTSVHRVAHRATSDQHDCS